MIVTNAEQTQAAQLAELLQSAGDHLPFYLWQIESGGRSTPLEVGQRRIESKRDFSKFSYQNARVCSSDNRIVGVSVSYKLEPQSSLLDLHEHCEPIIPILMLEKKVPGAWYVQTLSVDENKRQCGIGKLLTKDAERLAASNGCEEIAIIVNSANKAALSLYGSRGYISKDQVPAVPYPNYPANSYWILLTLPLASSYSHIDNDAQANQHYAQR